MKLSIVIPVYNELLTIEETVRRVQATGWDKEIIVVDDASTDGTGEILARLQSEGAITASFHPRNRGKGAALRTAFGIVSGDIVIIQDADLEYDPRDYANLLEPLLDGRADVVFGSRFLGGPHRVLLFWHTVANRIVTLLSNMLNNLNLTDMETCYKAFKADVLRNLRLRENRFGFEPEFTAKVARRKHRIYEVPISYSGRDYEEGKKLTWRDGLYAIWAVVRYAIAD